MYLKKTKKNICKDLTEVVDVSDFTPYRCNDVNDLVIVLPWMQVSLVWQRLV